MSNTIHKALKVHREWKIRLVLLVSNSISYQSSFIQSKILFILYIILNSNYRISTLVRLADYRTEGDRNWKISEVCFISDY